MMNTSSDSLEGELSLSDLAAAMDASTAIINSGNGGNGGNGINNQMLVRNGILRNNNNNNNNNSRFQNKSSSSSFHFGDPERQKDHIAKDESNAVQWLKGMVLFVLAVLAIAASAVVYTTMRQTEKDMWEDSVEQVGGSIIDTVQRNLQAKLAVLESLSVQTSSYGSLAGIAGSLDGSLASIDGHTWPQILLPDFHVQASIARETAHLLSLALIPIVSSANQTQRSLYEHFTVSNWQNQLAVASNDTIFPQIFRYDDTFQPPSKVPEGTTSASSQFSHHFPLWLMSPAVPDLVNYNTRRHPLFQDQLDALLQTHQIIMEPQFYMYMYMYDGEDNNNNNNNNDDAPFQHILRQEQAKYTTTQSPTTTTATTTTTTRPIGHIMVPITTQKQLVGLYSAFFDWTDLFHDQVSRTDHSDSIRFHCVLENPCSIQGKHTIVVDDPQHVTYLGMEDRHDTEYDHIEQTFEFSTLSTPSMSDDISRVSLNTQYCPFTLKVYPSKQSQDDYLTDKPIYYTLAVVLVFIITAITFLVYDCLIARRQKKILQSAMETRAILSSMFPSVVMDRLLEGSKKATGRMKRMLSAGKHKLTGSKNSNEEGEQSSLQISQDMSSQQQPSSPKPKKKKLLFSTADGDRRRDRRISTVHKQMDRIQNFLSANDTKQKVVHDGKKPIADLFPNVTVLFADICGFTSWSSQREPEQVFTLLQAVYGAFDRLAKRREVFKVETIGDCYVAATGLPVAQEDHAWRMVKFALECRAKLNHVTRDLEVSLGPDTGDLCMRFGMHSGPVTAGVLRAAQSRFQLFGDTVNTASRMESTGEKNRIQISQETADRLTFRGKGAWIRMRDELVTAKGKGNVQTYWVASRPFQAKTLDGISSHDTNNNVPTKTIRFALDKCIEKQQDAAGDDDDDNQSFTLSQNQSLSNSLSDHDWQQSQGHMNDSDDILGAKNARNRRDGDDEDDDDFGLTIQAGNMSTTFEIPAQSEQSSRNRFVLWQTDLLTRSLKAVLSQRVTTRSQRGFDDCPSMEMKADATIREEYISAIKMPDFNRRVFAEQVDVDCVELSMAVMSQIRDFVATIAELYASNYFHNFEHAAHVAMSANKFLNRISVPNENIDMTDAMDKHHQTNGLSSDKLAQFAVIFSSLIHDVDHPGVPNGQLSKEDPDIAELYRHKSVAESKSVDLAWDLLQDERYDDLRFCICPTNYELRRFRQLIVNCVLATDLFDSELQAIRDARWDATFPDTDTWEIELHEDDGDQGNPKATIILELVMQAADVSHTMQHWHVYRKWNARLFHEMQTAFLDGRAEEDPSTTWYEAELNFFDDIVIPLAQQMMRCEVFGHAGSECLSYAFSNRDEWQARGRDLVSAMASTFSNERSQSTEHTTIESSSA